MSTSELLIVLGAVICGATVKSVTGMGLPIVAIPIAALFVDLETAVAVMAMPSVIANSLLCFGERSHRSETRDLPVLVSAGIVGAVVGTIALLNVPSEPLIIALATALVAYVAHSLMMPNAVLTHEQATRFAPVVGFVGGLFQGSVGISGPVVGSWIHAYRLKPAAHIFSVTLIFSLSGAVQLAILAGTGELSGRFLASAAATVPVFLSIPVGKRLRGRLSSQAFDRAVLAVLAASAVSLIAKIAF